MVQVLLKADVGGRPPGRLLVEPPRIWFFRARRAWVPNRFFTPSTKKKYVKVSSKWVLLKKTVYIKDDKHHYKVNLRYKILTTIFMNNIQVLNNIKVSFRALFATALRLCVLVELVSERYKAGVISRLCTIHCYSIFLHFVRYVFATSSREGSNVSFFR